MWEHAEGGWQQTLATVRTSGMVAPGGGSWEASERSGVRNVQKDGYFWA